MSDYLTAEQYEYARKTGDWESGKVLTHGQALNDNQKIVFEWLKEAVSSGSYSPLHAISHLHTHVNLPTHYNKSPYKEYYTLNPTEEIRVLMTFAQWWLEQEESSNEL